MLIAAVVVGVLVSRSLLAGGAGPQEALSVVPEEPQAADWGTWALSSPDQITVPAPPPFDSSAARAELSELQRVVSERTEPMEESIALWDANPGVGPWIDLSLQLTAESIEEPPAASRGYALLAVAMHDATLAAWHWKYAYDRRPPEVADALGLDTSAPSYPSHHAAVAGAAAQMLAYLFPDHPRGRFEELAREAADSRVWAGRNYRSDVEAGLELGRTVAEDVIARARNDGSSRVWDERHPEGPQFWAAPPGRLEAPVLPLAGTWQTWVLESGSELRPGPPPEYGSPRFLEEAAEVMMIGNNLSDERRRIAKTWAGEVGTPLPPGLWNRIALSEVRRSRLSPPRAARVIALLNVALADAGVAAWDCKYAFWSPRPAEAIRGLNLHSGWEPYITTPLFPSYVSAHSAYSGAASEVLSSVFPNRALEFSAMAEEAGMSRIYGGIHYRSDHVRGLELGREVGRLAVEKDERMNSSGE